MGAEKSQRVDSCEESGSRSVKVDLHIGAQESEETSHSVSLDLAIISGVEVFPGLVEIFVKVGGSFLSFESHVGLNDFLGSHEGSRFVHVELSSWVTIWSGLLHGVILDHGEVELVITGSWSTDVFGNLSGVLPSSIKTI